ncbi:MAG: phage holin family protein [Burkholderiaceae bacterium]
MALPDSLANLGATCINMIRARLELIGLDLVEAVWRTAAILCLSFVATLLVFCASFFAAAGFIFHYWESHPLWAISVVSIVYLTSGLALLLLLYRWFSGSTFLLSDTIDSLRRDAQLLTKRT